MSIKDAVKNNLNDIAQLKQNRAALIIIGALLALLATSWIVMHKSSKSKPASPTSAAKAELAGVTDAEFTPEYSKQALEKQQKQIEELQGKMMDMSKELKDAQGALDEKINEPANTNTSISDLQTKVAELEESLSKSPGGAGGPTQPDGAATAAPITTVNFTYREGSQETMKSPSNYVPAGSFVKAVLLSGADANAGVHGQADTSPVTLRILDNGTLPNGRKSSLKGCFLVAAAYGDASSERGQIRLQRLSCAKTGQPILDIPIEGTINDLGGSDGIRGHVVMRNNKLIFNAGVAGVLSGVGSAMKQTLTTQTTTPLGGATQTILPNNAWKYGAVGGLDNAFTKLADYYIKLADMYHPIVQVHAGSEVTAVFLKGFSLSDGTIEDKSISKPNSQEVIPESVTQTLKTAEAGNEVKVNN